MGTQQGQPPDPSTGTLDAFLAPDSEKTAQAIEQGTGSVLDTMATSASSLTAEEQAKVDATKSQQTKEQEKQEKQAEKARVQAEKEQKEKQDKLQEAQRTFVTNISDKVNDGVEVLKDTTDKINVMPTPGGIAFLLAVIIFFIWAIVPTSDGHTRLELLFYTIMGRTSLVGGASGDFSATSQAQTIPIPSVTIPAAKGDNTPTLSSNNNIRTTIIPLYDMFGLENF